MHSVSRDTVREEVEKIDDPIDDTIDGATRAPVEPRTVAPEPAADYPELATIERRHYAILGEIAKGGMGRVLDARDLRLGRAVAIKELLPKHRDAARRFEREARITARLQHPAIIHVYEAGTWPGGDPFYAMTKVTGRSLTQVVAERKTLVDRLGLLPNVIAVADALAYAHSQDVIHRDLKPSNVLVGGFGETVVIDWGLAKDLAAPFDPAMSLEMRTCPAEQTLSGSVVGTPAYMPPEQARGEPVDHRADVYALGALLYKVLVGSPPYTASSSSDVLQQVLDGPPISVEEREPGAPADLVAIVKKAMARDPDARYPTAAELAADLKRFETGQLVAAHHYTRRQLLLRWFQRHRLIIAITTLAFVLLATFGTVFVLSKIEARNRAERRRATLLEERGRAELLTGRAGRALVYLASSVGDKPIGPQGFLLAEAMRPFEAQLDAVEAGEGTVLVAYRPDGTEFATASSDGVIRTWNTTGHRVHEIGRGFGRIGVIAWSLDSTMLAAGGDDGVIRVWSADGTLVQKLSGHTGPVNDVAFSPDGKRLVSGSADHTSRHWSVQTGESSVPTAFESAVTVAQFSPDGSLVVTGTEQGEAQVCCYSGDGDERRPDAHGEASLLRAHTAAIRVAKWSRSGEFVVTASADGTARIWDPEKGKVIAQPIRHGSKARIDDASWSNDGEYLITAGSDRMARLWNVPDPPDGGEAPGQADEVARLVHGDRVISARFSNDDRWIVTASNDGLARVWDAKGQLIWTFEDGDAVATVAVSPDSKSVVTGSRAGTARIWDLTHKIAPPRELGSQIHAIAVARDGRVAAGTDQGRVWLWQPDNKQNWSFSKLHVGRVFGVAFSNDATELVTAGDGDSVFVWRVGVDEPPRELRVGDAPVRAVAFPHDVVAGDDAGTLRIWSRSGELVKRVELKSKIAAIATHGSSIAVATERGVEIVGLRGDPVATLRTATPVRAIAFDARGEQLVIGTVRETIIARFANKTLSPRVTLDGATGDVTSAAFGNDGLVFTGGSDGAMRAWDSNGKLLATRNTGGEPIEGIAFSRDTELLWTGNSDGVARVLDVHAQRDVSGLRNFIASRVPWRLGDNDDVVRREK